MPSGYALAVTMCPFDPIHLTPDASLNRVILAELPGLPVEPGVLGHTAYELVSAAALAGLVRLHAEALDVERDVPASALCAALDARIDSPDPAARAAADAVVRQFGRRLGWVLLALRRGDAANRAARPEWSAEQWARWSRVRQVWLGGGLVSGWSGPAIVEHAREVLAAYDAADEIVRLSPYAGWLPLVGAARLAPAGVSSALALDFGGTRVKRAQAAYTARGLAGLVPYPALPTGWPEILAQADDPHERAALLLERMIEAVAEVWPGGTCDTVTASVAAYMRDGQPLEYQGGGYVTLRALGDNAARLLGERLSVRLGRSIQVTLLHDGSAAAAVYAGERSAAVITLGTALGIGFPPPAEQMRPFAPEFTFSPLDRGL
jgi:hypothetical protein